MWPLQHQPLHLQRSVPMETVVAWGDARAGGDCSAVQEQLHNVQLVIIRTFRSILLMSGGIVP